MQPKYQKILFVTNLGPEASYVFSHALSIAQQFNSQIYVLHVLEPLDKNAYALAETFISKEQLQKNLENARKDLLESLHRSLTKFCEHETCKLLDDAHIPDPVQKIQVQEGQAAETILKKAEEISAELIVIGAHRKSWEGKNKLLGSTSHKVVNNAQLPVLIVHTPKEQLQEADLS